MSKIFFEPLRLGAITAPNRILMAPMTRARGTRDHQPTPMMADYYVQRAGSGLIISEAIGISREGLGWCHATGLWDQGQIDGWRRITRAVHAAGGRILAQLWHMGRTVHPSFLSGAAPVSASETRAPRHAHTYAGKQPHALSRALALDEMPRIIQDYRVAAAHAMQAGFDGVQIHAANGYLLDQFLRDGSNRREDAYGGSISKRMRLLIEVTEAVGAEAGLDRTAVRLSPNCSTQGVADSASAPLFEAVATRLSALGIAFLELRDPPVDGSFGAGDGPRTGAALRACFSGPLVLNSDYDLAQASACLEAGTADAISFGRAFIANPDLPLRIARGLPWAVDDKTSWFTQDARGYLDYPGLPIREHGVS